MTGRKDIIEQGIKIADSRMSHEDRVWSKYSNDKVDIGEELMRVVRVLHNGLPLKKKMRAVSIGSSIEPQFRILETSFRAGLYLIDLEESALDTIRERIRRQYTDHVYAVHADYNNIFLNKRHTDDFFTKTLKGKPAELVTMHHSLYYSAKNNWARIFENVGRKILAPKSAIHAVLMSSSSDLKCSTTWLYNHFAGKYFGCKNDQDLKVFGGELSEMKQFRSCRVSVSTHKVKFYVDDFAHFMCVIWMILLYPNEHKYTQAAREEITEYVYENLWKKKIPLLQEQDHLVVFKGIGTENPLI